MSYHILIGFVIMSFSIYGKGNNSKENNFQFKDIEGIWFARVIESKEVEEDSLSEKYGKDTVNIIDTLYMPVCFLKDKMMIGGFTEDGEMLFDQNHMGWSKDLTKLQIYFGRRVVELTPILNKECLIFQVGEDEEREEWLRFYRVLDTTKIDKKDLQVYHEMEKRYESEQAGNIIKNIFIDTCTNILIKPEYNKMLTYQEFDGNFLISHGGKSDTWGRTTVGGTWGVASVNGDLVIPPKYDAVEIICNSHNESRSFIIHDSLWYLYDKKSGKTVSKGYDYISSFTMYGHAIVNSGGEQSSSIPLQMYDVKGGYFGLIDTSGEEVLKPAYTYIKDIDNEMFVARNNDNLWGVVSLKDKQIIPFEFNYISRMSEENLIAMKDSLYGVISTSGKTVIPFIYSHYQTDCGFFIGIDDSVGKCYRSDGKLLYEAKEVDILADSNDTLFYLSNGDKNGVITNGNDTIWGENVSYVIRSGSSFGNHVSFRVGEKEASRGLLAYNGKVLVNPIYRDINIINNNPMQYIVKKDRDTSMILDENQNILFKSNSLSSSVSLFLVNRVRGEKSYSQFCKLNNKKLTVLVDSISNYNSDDKYHRMIVKNVSGKWSVIDSNGMELFCEKYDGINSLSENLIKIMNIDSTIPTKYGKGVKLYGVYDIEKKKELIKCKYRDIKFINNKLILVEDKYGSGEDYNWGVKTMEDKEYMPLIFDSFEFLKKDDKHSVYVFEINDKKGIIEFPAEGSKL